MKRTLTLKSETLSELTFDELSMLAGAGGVSGASCPGVACKLSLLHAYCPSELTCPTE